MSVFAALFHKEENQQAEAEQRLHDIIAELARNPEADIDADEVSQALADVDWDARDLQRAVYRRRTINEIRDKQERASELRATKPDVEAEIAAIDAKLEAAKAEHRQALKEPRRKLTEIADAGREAHLATLSLRELVRPEDAEKLRIGREETNRLRNAHSEAKRAVRNMQAQADNARQTPAGWSKEGELEDSPERASVLRALERAKANERQAAEALQAAADRCDQIYADAVSN